MQVAIIQVCVTGVGASQRWEKFLGFLDLLKYQIIIDQSVSRCMWIFYHGLLYLHQSSLSALIPSPVSHLTHLIHGVRQFLMWIHIGSPNGVFSCPHAIILFPHNGGLRKPGDAFDQVDYPNALLVSIRDRKSTCYRNHFEGCFYRNASQGQHCRC